jgi:hypothetical protein
MSSEIDNRRVPIQGSVVVSLVAAVACALATDTHASRLETNANVGEQELTTRVARIVERIEAGDPALVRDLPPENKIAQWRN